MKVITLLTDDFESKCRELSRLIRESGTAYSFIVGIAMGGDHVGRIVAAELSSADTRYVTVVARRPSTRHKTRLVETVLRWLPRRLNDGLRIIEARLLASRKKPEKIDVEISIDDRQAIASASAPHILIVDDAVDSGTTMRSVADELRAINPQAILTTAAITQTTSTPLINVDFALYRNNTLIRFPWSKDMKRKQ